MPDRVRTTIFLKYPLLVTSVLANAHAITPMSPAHPLSIASSLSHVWFTGIPVPVLLESWHVEGLELMMKNTKHVYMYDGPLNKV